MAFFMFSSKFVPRILIMSEAPLGSGRAAVASFAARQKIRQPSVQEYRDTVLCVHHADGRRSVAERLRPTPIGTTWRARRTGDSRHHADPESSCTTSR